MKRLLNLGIVVLLCITAFPTVTFALGEDEGLLFMDIPEVVSASGKAESVEEAPAHIYVYTGKELMDRGYRTLYDLLEDLPGTIGNRVVHLGDTSDYPYPAGMTNHRGTMGGLKLLLDGMEIDTKSGAGTHWEERFPIEAIEKVEFILGPYASMYGRSSYSGVLNIVTKSGEAIDGGGVYALYGKGNQMQNTAFVGQKVKKWDLFLSLFNNYSREGLNMAEEYPDIYGYDARKDGIFAEGTADEYAVDFGPGVSKEFNTPYDNKEIYVKAKHDSGLEYIMQYNEILAPNICPRYSPLFYISPRDADMYAPTLNSRIKYSRDWDNGLNTQTWVEYQQYQWEARNMYIPGGWIKYMRTGADTVDFNQSLRYALSDSNEIYTLITFDQVKEKVMTVSYDKFVEWNQNEERDTQYLNVSVQDELQLTDKLKTVAGVMYENSDIHDDIFLPRVSVMAEASDKTIVKVLYGMGFVTPESGTSVDAPTPTGGLKGVDDLKPITITSYDVQLIHKLDDRKKVSLSAFYNVEADFITAVTKSGLPNGMTHTYVNIDGEKKMYGGELEFDALMKDDKIKTFASYSFVTGESDALDIYGDPIEVDGVVFTPEHQFKVGVNFLLCQERLNLYIHDIFMTDITNWPTLDDLDGYNLVDVNLKTTEVMDSDWVASVGVKNVLDQEGFMPPCTDLPYYIAPPIRKRTWSVQVGRKI
ncbi:TonB-dependent receptor plug domain-containing protein [Elusimicrobiota bacterium]